MAISDKKKVQTMINITAEQIIIVRTAITAMQEVRTTFQNVNPSTTGTPISGSVAAINTALNALDATVNGGSTASAWNLLINSHIDSHTGEALNAS